MRKATLVFAGLSLLGIIASAGSCHGEADLAAESEPASEQESPAGEKVVVIKSMETVDVTQSIPLSITNADGVKIAFQTTGNDLATRFTLREAALGEVSHHRDAYRFTGMGWNHSWGGGDWTPCLYRADQFLPQATKDVNGFTLIREGVPRKSSSANLTQLKFKATKNQVRNLVIYRGDDTTAPGAPEGVVVQAGDEGAQLRWNPAKDDVGVAWYVISRGAGKDKFVKVAQTANLTYTDKPPAAGAYRYRVLAVDYERNVGPWAKEVSVQAPKAFPQPEPTTVVKDRLYYAEHVRAVHEAGAGKVKKGFVYHYGDCINYLDRTQNRNRAILPLIPYTLFNGIRNPNVDLSPVTTSATLLKDVDKVLPLLPEFCVLTCGIEDLRASPPPEPRVVVNNALQMIKKFESQGTVVVFVTTNPYAKTNPVGSPEEALSDALVKMCEENKVPLARVFGMYRNAARSGADYAKLMTAVDTDTHGGAWPKGFAYAALWPSFEEGITRRLIVVKDTLDRVVFMLLDRPDGEFRRK